MSCALRPHFHKRFKLFGRPFLEFWREYFLSNDIRLRDLPIKYYMSAADLVRLYDLSICTCNDLVENLFGTKKYQCQHCSNEFNTSWALKQHMLMHRVKDKHRFGCIFCHKILRHKSSLKYHLSLHTMEDVCEICDQVLPHHNMERHVKTRKHLKNMELFESGAQQWPKKNIVWFTK